MERRRIASAGGLLLGPLWFVSMSLVYGFPDGHDNWPAILLVLALISAGGVLLIWFVNTGLAKLKAKLLSANGVWRLSLAALILGPAFFALSILSRWALPYGDDEWIAAMWAVIGISFIAFVSVHAAFWVRSAFRSKT